MPHPGQVTHMVSHWLDVLVRIERSSGYSGEGINEVRKNPSALPKGNKPTCSPMEKNCCFPEEKTIARV